MFEYLQWSRETAERVSGPVMRCEVHDGLQDVFTPGALNGVRASEEICTTHTDGRDLAH